MKIIKLCFVISVLMISKNSNAQEGQGKAKTKPEKIVTVSKLSLSFGLGDANYYGDLIKGNSVFTQNSFSLGGAATYNFTPHFAGRFNLGILQIKGDDSQSGGAHPSRNLSVKTTIFDFSIAAEVDISDMLKHKFGPFAFVGIGAAFFNPTAVDASGKKENLRDLGTEGQGLTGYPGKYSKVTAIFPVGFGFKYAASPNVTIEMEFTYHFTGTDYLDDVSTSGYPDPSLLSARTKEFTWRGSGPYPANLKLARGNPDNKDGFYTSQLKVGFKL